MADHRDAPEATHPLGSPEKDPDEWTTGDEPMTGAQASYLRTLGHEAGVDDLDESMTKAEASRRIDEPRARTGRDGTEHADGGNADQAFAAFDADAAVTHPGHPVGPVSPATDSDTPPPG